MQASFMPNIHMHHTVIENAQHQQARRVFAVVSNLSLERDFCMHAVSAQTSAI